MTDALIAGEEAEVTLTLRTAAGLPLGGATGVQIRAKPPGAEAVRSYAATAGGGTGEWVALVQFDLPGRWWVAGECTGPARAIAEIPIEVRPRAVP